MTEKQTKKLQEIENILCKAYKSLDELSKEVAKDCLVYDSSEGEEMKNAVDLTADAIDAIQYCREEFGQSIW